VSGGTACACPERLKPVKERKWLVRQFMCNHSAFNGYHYTRSDYSSINCTECGHVWRTKAAYVFDLEVRGYYE
jgi:hypothetical protein